MSNPIAIPVMNSELYNTTSASAGRGQVPPGVPAQPSGPPTGLIGSEMALAGGYDAALAGLLGGYGQAQQILSAPGAPAPTASYNPGAVSYSMDGVTRAIGQGVAGVEQGINQGVQTLDPFAQPGAQSLQLQAALAGAMGAPAQQQAYSNFQESPGQQYLREQSERALLRNSAAIGGLGGGNVRQELSRQAIGLAAQDFDKSFERLGSITGTGLTAASNQAALRGQGAGYIGQLRGQEAGIAGNLEGQRMGVLGSLEGQRMGTQGNIDTASMAAENARRLAMGQNAISTGQNVGELGFQTGNNVAAGRTQAGRDIATAVGGTVSSLANLADQGGADIAEQIGESAGDLSTIIAGAGAGASGSQANLAALLAQIIGGQGNQIAGLPGVPGVQNIPGVIGNVGNAMQGAGALMASDIRLKENIQRIGTSANGIPLYVWDWNEDGRRVTGETSSFGVIAQEVMATHPEAVAEGEDGWLRVNYGTVFNG